VAARRRAVRVLVLLLPVLAGCGSRDEGPAATQDPEKIHEVVQGLLEAHGGDTGLDRAASYRAEGTVVRVEERDVADLVRWFEGGRVRLELRSADRGEIRVLTPDSTWIGSHDRDLTARRAEVADRLLIEALRRNGPLAVLERQTTLSLLVSKKEDTIYLFSSTDDSLEVEYRIDPESHRILEVALSSDEDPDVLYRVVLEEYRWVKGALFPFKEVHFLGDRRIEEVRFRSVKLSPEIPAPLVPAVRDTGGS
jgi:hypothetical protein